jgi:hypothetical protein
MIYDIPNLIINFFILSDFGNLNDFYKYIKQRYNESISINEIKNELSKLIRNKIIYNENNIYKLTDKGIVILNDNKYYYSRIIINFFKKYSKNTKKYELKEIRLEQQKLRTFLIDTKEHKCIICRKKLPLCLLETAHLKPRFLLSYIEKNDNNIVELMCRYCHSLYDNGFLAIYKNTLQISNFLKQNNNYDLEYNNLSIDSYNKYNMKYFDFHFKYIYKNK